MEYSGTISIIYPVEKGLQKFIISNIWSSTLNKVVEDRMLVVVPEGLIKLKIGECITVRSSLKYSVGSNIPILYFLKEYQESFDFFIRYKNKVHTIL